MATTVDSLPLFASAALARRTDPETSHEAAASVDTNALESLVLDELRGAVEGLTSHQVADRTGESLVSVSPRMAPLERKGLIERAGKRGRRTIWRIAR